MTERLLWGFDLSLRRTGYALLSGDENHARVITRGLIITSGDHAYSLSKIYSESHKLLSEFPYPVYVEVPGVMNAKKGRSILTVEALSEALGAFLAACGGAGVGVTRITQSLVKQLLTGYQYADKPAIHQHLDFLERSGTLTGYKTVLKSNGRVDEDLDDAVAVALGGLNREYLKEVENVGKNTSIRDSGRAGYKTPQRGAIRQRNQRYYRKGAASR